MLRPLIRALPSVIVDTEKVLREADGSVELVVVRPRAGGKVFAPGCASKPDGESWEEPEEQAPIDKNHKDPETIDLNSPRHAQYMHNAWKRHQNTVYWVDINLALRKGLKFYHTRSNAIILHETLPAYCIPKVVRMGTGEIICEKVYESPRVPPKISLKHDWKRELGSEDAQRPDGQVVQQFRSSQSNQPTPNPDHDRTEQPVVGTDPRIESSGRKTSRSQ